MGVNQNGLTIIEEDSPLPPDAKTNRRFQQPENGTAEGLMECVVKFWRLLERSRL